MPIISVTLVADGTPALPALINTDWVAYAFEDAGPPRVTQLKLASPHMETLHVTESLAEIKLLAEME